MKRFVGHLGGMLVSPRATLKAVLSGESGGMTDLLLLLCLQVLALHLQALVHDAWFMVVVSYHVGVSALLNRIAESILLPIGAVFVGTIILGFVARKKSSGAGGRTLDLVCLATIPPVCLELFFSLFAVVSGIKPLGSFTMVLLAGASAWFIALLLLSMRLVLKHEE